MLVQASRTAHLDRQAQAGNGEDQTSRPSRCWRRRRARPCSRRRARFLISRSALSASSSSHAWRNALRTLACKGLARRSVMLRALWTWQRWIGVWRPKVLRIALDSALAPSMMNRRQTAGSRPRRPGCRAAPAPRRYSRSPPRSNRGDAYRRCHRCRQAASSIKSSSMWMPSIWMISRSRLDRSAAIHRFMRSADNATNRRDTADLDTPAPFGAGTSPSGRRTARPNLRVETLISIRLSAHLPSRSSDNAELPARQGDLVAVAGTSRGAARSRPCRHGSRPSPWSCPSGARPFRQRGRSGDRTPGSHPPPACWPKSQGRSSGRSARSSLQPLARHLR